MTETEFFILSYVFCAALCWHLVQRECIPGPWNGTCGGYPRAIILFPYYLPWYVTAFIIYHGVTLGKKIRAADDRFYDLGEEIIVAIIISIYFVAKMFGFVEAEEKDDWESGTAR